MIVGPAARTGRLTGDPRFVVKFFVSTPVNLMKSLPHKRVMSLTVPKKILFVDDNPQVLEGLERMFSMLEEPWVLAFSNSGVDALAQLRTQEFDIIVTDVRMPGMSGAQLLQLVQQQYPDIVRIILSGQRDNDAIFRSFNHAHQYLSKPCSARELERVLAHACTLREALLNEHLSYVAEVATLPSVPDIYRQLIDLMADELPPIDRAVRLIKQDVGISVKLLQLANSARLGKREPVYTVEQAVADLGLETVRSLAIADEVFYPLEPESHAVGFNSVDWWRHSMDVSYYTGELLNLEKADREYSAIAKVSGLLHDCGTLLLATQRPADYEQVLAAVTEKGLSLYDAETEVLGVTHAQVGAYYLELREIPPPIVEATGFHHQPSSSPAMKSIFLAALHAADVFTIVKRSAMGSNPFDYLDLPYLKSMGLEAKIPTWLRCCVS